ncbi:MAG: ATP-dependent helicase [Candidatus Woesearchaeota archaeon]
MHDTSNSKVTWVKEPYTTKQLTTILHPLVKQWFFEKFPDYALPQKYGVMPIHSRENILISSPTGSGKTLTGFLAILNELVDSALKGILEDKVYAIYISPLKALGTDIKHNLIEPLAEIEKLAQDTYGIKSLGIRIATRTGDTSPYERQKMLKNAPHILITTPESLALMLASPKFKTHLNNIDWVIIDEIHALAENKRGVHLNVFLEHLQYHSPGLTRVGLSATVSPLEEVAKFLAGPQRPIKIVDIAYLKEIDIEVLSPVPDLVNTDYAHIQEATYNMIHDLIKAHKTTLIFTNTRAGTERVVHTLKQKFPASYYEIKENAENENMSLIGAHHGSLSKDHRFAIEQQLRDGKLKAVVCSTSLELGIDIGSIDLVLLLGSPKSVARALQRAGRSGHRLQAVTKAKIIVMDRDDLVECSILLKNALERKIDTIHIPQNALDILVQHILGFVTNTEIDIDELYAITKQSYCYQHLSKEDYLEVIRYLCGGYDTLENRNIFSKIYVDENMLRRKGTMTRVLYTSNLGSIPSSGGILVKSGELGLGMIDENFLEKLKRGDTFVLGGDVYEFLFARGMTAQVKAAYHKSPSVPRWYSETLPLSFDLANDIQTFRSKVYNMFKENQSESEVCNNIKEYTYVHDTTAKALYNYMYDQYIFDKENFPKSDTFVVEIFHDSIFKTKKKYHIFHSLNGRKVNEALSRTFACILGKYHHKDIEVGINDNGFYLASTVELEVGFAFTLIHDMQKTLKESLKNTEVLRRRFRHCAERSFMILRSYKGHTKRIGRQQVSSQILLKAAENISKDFIILKEAYREVMYDAMDIENALAVFESVEKAGKKLQVTRHTIPSPFATNLILQGYADIVTVEDRQQFLKNMHALVHAKIDGKLEDPSVKEQFSYDQFWTQKEKHRERTLKDDILIACRKEKVPVDIRLELLNCVENPEKMLSEKATAYFEEAFTGVVSKNWSDKAYMFIKKLL